MVTDAKRLLHVVIGHEDGDSRRGKSTNFGLKFLHGVGIDRGERFIEKNQFRFGDQGTRNFKSSSFTTGTGSRLLAGLVF